MIAERIRSQARSQSLQAARGIPTRWVVAPLFFIDALCIIVSMVAAYQLRFHLLNYYADFSPGFYSRLVVAAVLMGEAIFAFYRLYHEEHLFGGVQEYINVINACTVSLIALILYTFLDRRGGEDISRGWLAFVWFLSIISIGSARLGYRRIVYLLRRRGVFTRRALIVGANQEGREVAHQLSVAAHAGIQVVGFVDSTLVLGTEVEQTVVRGGLENLKTLVDRWGVEELIVIPTALGREALLDLYREWSTDDRVHVRLSSGLYELLTTGVTVKEVGFVPLLSLDKARITGVNALAKMAVDYVLSFLGIVLLAPLLLFLTILIKLDSPGPSIHRRKVIGMYGRAFDAFKFRTMIPDADTYLEAHPELKEEWETTGKLRSDPRITRVGSVLRRFSLDELPQLFNVLRGEMSLVGPRIITPAEQKHFGWWQHNRLTVRPGLTGLWQVSGRSDLSYDDRVWLDMYYIRNYTIWLDLQLLINTVLVVLSGRGAY